MGSDCSWRKFIIAGLWRPIVLWRESWGQRLFAAIVWGDVKRRRSGLKPSHRTNWMMGRAKQREEIPLARSHNEEGNLIEGENFRY